ncbi:MAG TPA: hypothetical protein VFY18_04220 [Candidatus Limnocylindrales bacterium]|nr:hypothetical protein [Candidatus Limnocylindrales bacterium]
MPTDLLFPAFALTLLANAVLVAMAVRGLARGRAARDDEARDDQERRPQERPPGGMTAEPIFPDPAAPTPTGTTEPSASPVSPAPVLVPPPAPKPIAAPAKPPRRPRAARATGATGPRPAIRPDAPDESAVGPSPMPPSPRRRGAPKPGAAGPARSAGARATDGDAPGPEARRGGRRRFSLPPHDEDHERINRSIETFLSGNDSVEPTEAGPDNPTVATTVAIVAIDGLENDASIADREAVDGVVATVERTLRGAARSADRVTAAGIGRFQVVLPATGELAARAYLRRVRATVGPSLDSADAALGLVTATATVLDDTVAVAAARASARLDAALGEASRQAMDVEPRVASD